MWLTLRARQPASLSSGRQKTAALRDLSPPLCLLWISLDPRRVDRAAGDVRFALKADQQQTISAAPFCAKPNSPLQSSRTVFSSLIVWLPRPLGGQHENSPQAISTFGRRCRRPSGLVADPSGVALSDPPA